MGQRLNKVRNASFSAGAEAPRSWTWRAPRKHAAWCRGEAARDDLPGGVILESRSEHGIAAWVQTIHCKPLEFYLVAARVSCDLAAEDEHGGFVLSLQPLKDGRLFGRPLETPGLHRTAEPLEVRAYFQAPEGSRSVELSVGIQAARGTAQVHDVRFMHIVEPDEESHAMAIPPPGQALDPPRVVRRLCVVTAEPQRPLIHLFRTFFGERNVTAIEPKHAKLDLSCDALLFPDDSPPSVARSLRALERLAEDRLVVISLPAFAELSKGALSVRRIRQPDDPMHAKVTFATAHTTGFALADVFPFAWRGANGTDFRQNHFRRTEPQKAFFKKHGIVSMLTSMGCQDATSDRPLCLYKPTSGGGLFVMDLDPAEAPTSSYGESTTAVHFILSVLGQSPFGLGQYVVPERKEGSLRERIREMTQRFAGWVVHDDDVPSEEVTSQLVTIGQEDQSFGLPLAPKPLILIRSGLHAGDAESIYGSFLWFKQLVRMAPYECPYAQALASRFRLAWIPSAAPWDIREGFKRTRRPPEIPTELDLEPGTVAAVLDVVSCPVNRVRLVVPGIGGSYERIAEWLPRLQEVFPVGDYFAPTVPDGEPFADRSRFGWRRVQPRAQVVAQPDCFRDPVHESVREVGGQLLRLEIPGSDSDYSCLSIVRNDLTATLIEQVVGLQFGLIAVNRRPQSVVFDGQPPIAPGQALILDWSEVGRANWASEAG